MPPATLTERRQDPVLRARVDAAFVLIAPFFDPARCWAGHSQDMLAYRTLRDHMPEIDALEAELIVSIARRMAGERLVAA